MLLHSQDLNGTNSKVVCFACGTSQCFHCGSEWDAQHQQRASRSTTSVQDPPPADDNKCPIRYRPFTSRSVTLLPHPLDGVGMTSPLNNPGPTAESHTRQAQNTPNSRDNPTPSTLETSSTKFPDSKEKQKTIKTVKPNKGIEETDSDEEDSSNQQPDLTSKKEIRTTTFTGRIHLVDNEGWKQKMYVRYRLKVHPLRTSDDCSRHSVKVAVDQLSVRVTQSEFNEESRPPQFHLCRTKINLKPSVDGFGDEFVLGDYCDDWDGLDQEPLMDDYNPLPSSIGTETGVSARIQVGLQPNLNLEVGRKTSRTEQLIPISRVVDVKNSEITAMPSGGLQWNYSIRPQLSESHLNLGVHKGCFGFPCSKPPASIEANVESLLTVARKTDTRPWFFGKRRIIGIFVGYRHIKIGLKVDVRWHKSGPALTSSEKDTTIHHCFQTREGCLAPQQKQKQRREFFGYNKTDFMEVGMGGLTSDEFV